MTNLKLTLKVLKEIQEDLSRVESQLARVKDETTREIYRNQVRTLQAASVLLHDHYKIILEAQK